jgi:clan AA aspartic protease
MKGKVSQNFEAILHLRIVGPKSIAKVAAVIDTGYNGALTLPSSLIRALGLPRMSSSTATLADGSAISFDIYAGTVLWHGKKIVIDIDETGTDPLIGMQLLEGSELNVRVRRGGSIAIRPLP